MTSSKMPATATRHPAKKIVPFRLKRLVSASLPARLHLKKHLQSQPPLGSLQPAIKRLHLSIEDLEKLASESQPSTAGTHPLTRQLLTQLRRSWVASPAAQQTSSNKGALQHNPAQLQVLSETVSAQNVLQSACTHQQPNLQLSSPCSSDTQQLQVQTLPHTEQNHSQQQFHQQEDAVADLHNVPSRWQASEHNPSGAFGQFVQHQSGKLQSLLPGTQLPVLPSSPTAVHLRQAAISTDKGAALDGSSEVAADTSLVAPLQAATGAEVQLAYTHSVAESIPTSLHSQPLNDLYALWENVVVAGQQRAQCSSAVALSLNPSASQSCQQTMADSSSRPDRLGVRIRNASSWQELQQLCDLQPHLPCSCYVAVLSKVAELQPSNRVRGKPETKAFHDFIAHVLSNCSADLHFLTPPQITTLLTAVCQLKCKPPQPFMMQITSAVSALLPDFDPRDLVCVVSALAKIGYDPGSSWLDTICLATQPQLKNLQPPFLSDLLWAFATLKHNLSPPWLETFFSLSKQLPYHNFSSQQLANTVWALAVQEASPPEQWLKDVTSATATKLGHFSSYEVAITLWSFVTLKWQPPSSWINQAVRIMTKGAEPQHISIFVWSLATLQHRPPSYFIETVLEHSYLQLFDFSSQSLANILWGLAKMGIKPTKDWRDVALAACFDRKLETFQPEELSMLLWALAKMRHVPDAGWMQAFWVASYQQLEDAEPQHLSNIVWAAVRLGQAPPRKWLNAFLKVTHRQHTEFSAASWSNILVALAALEHRPSREWLQTCLSSMQQQFDDFNSLTFERVLSSLAKLEVEVEESWMQQFLTAAQPILPTFTHISLANLALALSVVKYRPAAAWLQDFVAAVDSKVDRFYYVTFAKLTCGMAYLWPEMQDRWFFREQQLESKPRRRKKLRLRQLRRVL